MEHSSNQVHPFHNKESVILFVIDIMQCVYVCVCVCVCVWPHENIISQKKQWIHLDNDRKNYCHSLSGSKISDVSRQVSIIHLDCLVNNWQVKHSEFENLRSDKLIRWHLTKTIYRECKHGCFSVKNRLDHPTSDVISSIGSTSFQIQRRETKNLKFVKKVLNLTKFSSVCVCEFLGPFKNMPVQHIM